MEFQEYLLNLARYDRKYSHLEAVIVWNFILFCWATRTKYLLVVTYSIYFQGWQFRSCLLVYEILFDPCSWRLEKKLVLLRRVRWSISGWLIALKRLLKWDCRELPTIFMSLNSGTMKNYLIYIYRWYTIFNVNNLN